MSRFITLTTIEGRFQQLLLGRQEAPARTRLEVRSVASFLVLFLEKRKAVELDHLVRHPSTTKEVANCLGEKQDDL
jgi:hypothetical protein